MDNTYFVAASFSNLQNKTNSVEWEEEQETVRKKGTTTNDRWGGTVVIFIYINWNWSSTILYADRYKLF